MILTIINLTEIIALITLVVGVITAIAAIVVIHNAKLKYGLLIFLGIVVIGSIAVLCRISPGSEPKPANSNGTSAIESQNSSPPQNSNTPKNRNSSNVDRPPIPVPPRKYEVTLIIPSHMSKADILVDEKPAEIIDRQLTVVKIRVNQKNQPTKILLRKGEQQCTQTLLIQENMQLTPCS